MDITKERPAPPLREPESKLRPAHWHEHLWAYVDIRVNKDGTCEVVMCDRWNSTPLPMSLYCKRETASNPIPDLKYDGLDLPTAMMHARILDTLFIAEFKGEKADYGQHTEYVAGHLDPDWEAKLKSRNERGALVATARPASDNAFQSRSETAFALESEKEEPPPEPVKPAAKAKAAPKPKPVLRPSARNPLADLDTF